MAGTNNGAEKRAMWRLGVFFAGAAALAWCHNVDKIDVTFSLPAEDAEKTAYIYCGDKLVFEGKLNDRFAAHADGKVFRKISIREKRCRDAVLTMVPLPGR